ncbi:TPA: hypothetical protein SAY52_001644 [Burkholderia cenocepacia]|jgi:hypothetical protein|uniref:hypothetical protein n=1 Tax=Burkholderia TaxID=32008 RepID=UPI00158DBA2A|nr:MULTISPECIES: hypothetical protein [Burkholderia]MCA7922708.1 hypothetical protein [Burkholderia cenocepacia]HEF5871057.1 hypothetical protein [Burkholderia cenocepacia]
MQELNQQEIAQVAGGYYSGPGIPSALGNIIEWGGSTAESIGNALTFGIFAAPVKQAYNIGETITTAAVNLLDGLFGGPIY